MKSRSISTHNLLLELAQRPAMNGGFKKLQRQQTRQCKEQVIQSRRLERLESDMASLRSAGKWVLRLATAVLIGVSTELVLRLAQHIH